MNEWMNEWTIVDVLPVQTSVDIFNHKESDILLVMLGSVDQDIIQELSPDLWSIMMFYIAKFMYPLYKNNPASLDWKQI